MRLHRLEVEGFGPFRTRQVVDFDTFADDGIFLIAGRTGAGKSSILDAVCFGLYGGVPRYDGGEKRLRSDHSEPDDISEVVVEFSTPSGRYRVTRSPEYLRPAKRGGGMTKQAAAVSLEEHGTAGWVGRAARAVDVGNELDEILQLSREQFLQVILLAQNRFSEFLLANSKDRQALLRRLFGTERFDDVQARFDERRRASERAVETRMATIGARLEEAERLVLSEGLGGSSDEGDEVEIAEPVGSLSTASRLESLRRAEARAAYRAERRAAERDDAERALAAADIALTEVKEQRIAQSERDRARRSLESLDSERDDIERARGELEQARRAEALRGVIDAVTRAEHAAATAASGVQEAASAWQAVGGEIDGSSASALQDWASAQTRESGAWVRAATLEAETAGRRATLDAAADMVAATSARVDALVAEREGLPAAIAEVTDARDAARRLADRAGDLTLRRDQAQTRRDAVREVERLGTAKSAADSDLADASIRLADAQTALAHLRRRRLDGFAGELASTLVDGASCPVCGAVEHPAPAVHADPVSADDVDAAEVVRDAAAARERDASERCATLRAELAVAVAAAEARTADEADAELGTLDEQLHAAIAAGAELSRHEAELAQLLKRSAALDDDHLVATRALAEARENLAALEQSAREADALIAEARGDFDSVAQRVTTTNSRITAATALALALADQRQRDVALAEAITARQSALDDSPFVQVSEVAAALRPAREQASLDEKITRHAVQREKEKGILLPLELRGLPEEAIDLGPAETAARDARSTWIAAVDITGKATVTVERLSGLIASAADEHERSAHDAAEHEVLQNLADTIAGRGPNTRKMTLETFVLAAELEEIVAAANRRLHDMSTGRYQLQHSDALAARGAASGLGIVVFDAFTGLTRPAQSLSGGETFLSSLALALGLAEVVTARAGGIRLDTLFIDEGFGSLDGDTLDIAMRTLDELRQGGRTVGVISHVEAMQDQIPAQLRVRATREGPSIIETR